LTLALFELELAQCDAGGLLAGQMWEVGFYSFELPTTIRALKDRITIG
jgi:hypothetical protein